MIGQVNSVFLNNKKASPLSFKGAEETFVPDLSMPADKFISDVNKVLENEKKGDPLSRFLWAPTALIPGFGGLFAYEFYMIRKIGKLEKAGNSPALKLLKSSFKKKFPFVILAAVGFVAGVQHLLNKNSDKKYEKMKNTFNELNTSTNAYIADETFRSSVKGAFYSPISGRVSINQNLVNDPYSRRKCKKLIKHELVHAKQYETIARSENGINKLNYAVMKSMAKVLETPEGKTEINAIYNNIVSDKTGKYDNYTLQVSGAEVDLKNYITALYILVNNKDAGVNDIPLVIDAQHYEAVRKEKGALTKEESEKAEKYYQAQLDYPQLTAWQMLNPFSEYRDNLLEREAYKENPGLSGFIRKLCGKD